MAYGYVMAQVEVTEPVAFNRYREAAGLCIARFDGEFLARGGARYVRLEGDEPLPNLFIVRFPTYERALEWFHSDEYSDLRTWRDGATISHIVLVEGADPAD